MIRRNFTFNAALFLTSCASGLAQRGSCTTGEISYYAAKFDGRKTASGEMYHNDGMTAAHRTLPFGAQLRVTVDTKQVRVRVNDRGPFARSRVLDVSGRAARALDLTGRGHALAEVCWE